jgi:hypothetical protein
MGRLQVKTYLKMFMQAFCNWTFPFINLCQLPQKVLELRLDLIGPAEKILPAQIFAFTNVLFISMLYI